MVATLSPEDHLRISAAVVKAEQSVGVDIKVIWAHASSHYGAFVLIHTLIAVLIAGCVPSIMFPHLSATTLISVQLVIAILTIGILQNSWLRVQLVPNASLRKAAARQARLHFADLKLRTRHDCPALLIYCSKAERYAEILVDQRILEKVPQEIWAPILSELMSHLRDKNIVQAFIHTVEKSTEALGNYFPVGESTRLRGDDDFTEI